MDNSKTAHHISEQFNKELEEIRTQVLTMGCLVELQLDLAMNAFTGRDFKQAEQCIKLLNQVFTIRKALDRECMQILALRQPTAFDLRLIITVIKIIYELEMAGELAEYIAKIALQLTNDEGKQETYAELQEVSKSVQALLHNALEGFSNVNINAVMTVQGLDENINGQYKALSRKLISQMMEDPKKITRLLDQSRTARALERIGYHSLHIYEELVYMVNGDTVNRIG